VQKQKEEYKEITVDHSKIKLSWGLCPKNYKYRKITTGIARSTSFFSRHFKNKIDFRFFLSDRCDDYKLKMMKKF